MNNSDHSLVCQLISYLDGQTIPSYLCLSEDVKFLNNSGRLGGEMAQVCYRNKQKEPTLNSEMSFLISHAL